MWIRAPQFPLAEPEELSAIGDRICYEELPRRKSYARWNAAAPATIRWQSMYTWMF